MPENTKISLEASPIENMDTIVHHQQSDTRMNETTETDFNSLLLDGGTLFSSHTVITLNDLEDNEQNNNNNRNTNNTHLYQNHQHRQPVNSTEMKQNSDPLNTIIAILPNVNTLTHTYTGMQITSQQRLEE